MVFDHEAADLSFLNNLRDDYGPVDERLFTTARPLPHVLTGLSLSLERGRLFDVNFGAFDLMVVHAEAMEILRTLCPDDLEQFPASIAGHDHHSAAIIKTRYAIDCIDRRLSVYSVWTHDGPRADKAGKPRVIDKLVVDPTKVGEHHLFRLFEWEVILIASATLKQAFEQNDISGARFDPLTEALPS